MGTIHAVPFLIWKAWRSSVTVGFGGCATGLVVGLQAGLLTWESLAV